MAMDEAQRAILWRDYARLGSQELREKLILEYAPLVKIIAGRLSMYLGYNVEYEDLVSYGTFGLIDAIDKYDALKQNKFDTYVHLGSGEKSCIRSERLTGFPGLSDRSRSR